MLSITSAKPKLSPQDVDFYLQQGYLIYNQNVFSADKFSRLKGRFEDLLKNLPPHVRPESMDVPHFLFPELFEWLFDDDVLDLIEPIIGPDIALFSSHFICKPSGDGKRVPWHEDSAYWRDMVLPMEICTVWLAIDPSFQENGCMRVIPKTHDNGYSTYEDVDTARNVFPSEIVPKQRDTGKAVSCILQPGQASLHHARTMHGSEANTSKLRRCGYTMRYMSTKSKFNDQKYPHHQIYLARGKDYANNVFADPTKTYGDLSRFRAQSGKNGH